MRLTDVGYVALFDTVTELVREFKTDTEELDDEYYYGDYVDEHIDALIYAIGG